MSPESQIWEMPDQTKSLEKFRFKNLACQRRMNHARRFQVTDLSPHAAHAKFTIVIADLRQPPVGMILNTHAVHLVAIGFERLCHAHWKISPTGNQADAAVGAAFARAAGTKL